jgi:uncharacterized protein YeaO (DUF488 family)
VIDSRLKEAPIRRCAELRGSEALANLRNPGRKSTVTLLYAVLDREINHAVVLTSVPKPSRKRRQSSADS